ncbi:MAG: hypothetical protein M5U12_26510 [Verrucomicrobia bacterium]|nr:hypothetical protein [Verrucomicrobiota bacterium]
MTPKPNPSPSAPASPAAAEPADLAGCVDRWARLRHDLRTPASHILGYAELLREQATALDRPQLLPDLDRIASAGRQLVDLIREELSPDKLAGGPSISVTSTPNCAPPQPRPRL